MTSVFSGTCPQWSPLLCMLTCASGSTRTRDCCRRSATSSRRCRRCARRRSTRRATACRRAHSSSCRRTARRRRRADASASCWVLSAARALRRSSRHVASRRVTALALLSYLFDQRTLLLFLSTSCSIKYKVIVSEVLYSMCMPCFPASCSTSSSASTSRTASTCWCSWAKSCRTDCASCRRSMRVHLFFSLSSFAYA